MITHGSFMNLIQTTKKCYYYYYYNIIQLLAKFVHETKLLM